MIWDPPAERDENVLDVTSYTLTWRRADADVSAAQSVDLDVVSPWAGPKAGYYVAVAGGEAVHPGVPLAFTVTACNMLGCSDESGVTELSPGSSVPSAAPPPVVMALNSTTIVVGVREPPAFTGGSPVTTYELRWSTEPATTDESIELVGTPPLEYPVHDRRLDVSYSFQVRAKSALGDGPWSDVLLVQSGAVVLPNTPLDVDVVDGTIGARGFTLSWRMPTGNRSEGLIHYRLLYTTGSVSSDLIIPVQDTCSAGCTYAVSGFTPATSYDVRLQAENTLGPSVPSTGITVATISTKPDQIDVASVDVQTALTRTPPATSYDTLLVSWTTPPSNGQALTKYVVTACEVDGGCQTFDAAADATEKEIQLVQGRNYTVAVEAENGAGLSEPTLFPETVTTPDVPLAGNEPIRMEPLPGLSPQTSLRVSWAAPYDNGVPITAYALRVDGRVETISELADGATTAEFTLTPTFPGTSHTFSVAAVNALGTGAYSIERTYATLSDVPGAPPAPKLLLLNITHIKIELQQLPYSGGYDLLYNEIEFHNKTTKLPIPADADTWSPAPVYWVSDRDAGLEYTFVHRVVATRGAGEGLAIGPWSAPLEVPSVKSLAPSTPQNVAVSNEASRSFDVSWHMNQGIVEEGVIRFQLTLFVGTTGGDNAVAFIPLEGYGACTSTCTAPIDDTNFAAIAPASRYRLEMRAENSYDLGSANPDVVFALTKSAPPDTVGDLEVGGETADALQVTWERPAGNGAAIETYKVSACDVQSAACVTQDVTAPAEEVTISGLPSGRNYTVSVEAINNQGSSGPEVADGFYTTKAAPMQPEPPFKAPSLGGLDPTTNLHVMWYPPYDNGGAITSYDLEVDGVEVELNLEAQYILAELEPGTAHTFRVRATNTYGDSEWSDSFEATTTDDVPGPPTGPPEVLTLSTASFSVGAQPASYTGGSAILYHEIECDAGSPDVAGCDPTTPTRLDAMTFVLASRRGDLSYRLRTRAVNSNGAGAWSEVTTVASEQADQPPQPNVPSVVDESQTKSAFQLSFSMPAEAAALRFPITGYKVQLTSGAETTVVELADPRPCVDGCIVGVGGLAPFTTYDPVELIAVNEVGDSFPSVAIAVTTAAGTPDPATNISVVPDRKTTAGVTKGVLKVSWEVPNDNGAAITAYKIFACDVEAGEYPGSCTERYLDMTPGGANDPLRLPVWVEGLDNGRNYTVEVRVDNGQCPPAGCARTMADGFFTTLDAPMQPSPPFRAPPLDGLDPATTIHVMWGLPYDNGAGISYFKLDVDGVEYQLDDVDAVPQYIQTGLVPGTIHYYRVAAANFYGISPWSATFEAKTTNAVPGKPTGPPKVEVLDKDLIQGALQLASYEGGSPVLYYEVECTAGGTVHDGCDGTPQKKPDIPGVGSTAFDVDRRSYLTYTIRSRAVNLIGAGPWSDPLVVESDVAQLGDPPQSLSASAITPNSFALSWSMPADGTGDVLSYRLTLTPQGLSSADAFEQVIVSSDAATWPACTGGCEYDVTRGLTPATRYELKLRSVNSVGPSLASEAIMVETLASEPDAPSAVSVGLATADSLTVEWTAPAANGDPITSYKLYACDVQSFVCFVQPSGINPTRATVAGLPSGRNYTVSVEALNGIGSSGNATAAEESTTKAVPMDAYPPFLAPTLDGLDPTSNLHVMWHAPFANGEPIEKFFLEVDGVEHEVDLSSSVRATRHSDRNSDRNSPAPLTSPFALFTPVLSTSRAPRAPCPLPARCAHLLFSPLRYPSTSRAGCCRAPSTSSACAP